MGSKGLEDSPSKDAESSGPFAGLMSRLASETSQVLSDLAAAQELLQADKEQLDSERRAFEAEKEGMMSLRAAQSDVIELNVGGTRLATKRSTLCQAEGTLLGAMFSGRWEEGHMRDSQGSIFLDVDPWAMAELLGFLRRRQLAEPRETVRLPDVPKEKQGSWDLFVRFFNLREYLQTASQPALTFDADKLPAGVALQDGDTTLLQVEDSPMVRSLVCPTKLVASAAWRIEIKAMPGWLLLGVSHTRQPADPPQSQPTTYGWATQAQLFVAGKLASDSACKAWPGFQAGDVVLMKLAAGYGYLSVKIKRLPGQKFELRLLERESWHVLVGMSAKDTCVQVRGLTLDDFEAANFS